MTQARAAQVSLDSTPFYHCYVRCVRRAYLCGEDSVTGQNFDHRKQWIVSRLRYAVMSNHYHVVLHVDKQRALDWSKEEVAERWMQLFNGDVLVSRWLKDSASLDKASLEAVSETLEKWRERLHDISWFMRNANETIARMANEEEKCKGRFWEGRYKSQALLDEAAVLSCMAYVDLNPVRAGMEDDIVASDFTSVQQRLFDYAQSHSITKKDKNILDQHIEKQNDLEKELSLDALPKPSLMPFSGSAHTFISQALPFTQEDYFDLVDSTGRLVRDDKAGAISAKSTALISRLGINPDKWLDHVTRFNKHYGSCAGSQKKIQEYSLLFGRKWSKGAGFAKLAYANVP